MRINICSTFKKIDHDAYVKAKRLRPGLRKSLPDGVHVTITPQNNNQAMIAAHAQHKPQGFIGFFQRAVKASGEQLANIGDLKNLQLMQEKIAAATRLAQENLNNLIKK